MCICNLFVQDDCHHSHTVLGSAMNGYGSGVTTVLTSLLEADELPARPNSCDILLTDLLGSNVDDKAPGG